MFRIVAIVVLLLTAGLLVFQLRGRSGAETAPKRRGRAARGVVYAAMLAGLAIAAMTGLGTGITSQAPMTGWTLILHCVGAPLFAAGIAGVAVAFAGRYIDLEARAGNAGGAVAGGRRFWLMLLLALVAMLSGVLPMTPYFDAEQQRLLYETHRYSSLLLFAIVVLHVPCVVPSRG